MSKSLILSLLAQGNTGSEILTILDSIVADIEQENIDDAAAYFAALWYNSLCALWLTLGGTYVMIWVSHRVMREWQRLTVFCGWLLMARAGAAVIKKGSFLTYKGDNSIARYHALQKNSHRKKCTHTLTEEHHTGTSGRLFLQVGVYDIHE